MAEWVVLRSGWIKLLNDAVAGKSLDMKEEVEQKAEPARDEAEIK